MRPIRYVARAAMASVLLAACQPKAETSTTPIEEAAASLEPCEAKFQATRAYVTFAQPPHDDVFFLGPLAAEEVISSLRATGCDPRADLPDHPKLVEALKQGALIIATITYIGDLPNAAEVVANEASFGDPNKPDALSFALRVQREEPFTMADTKPGAQTASARWRITSIAPRSQ